MVTDEFLLSDFIIHLWSKAFPHEFKTGNKVVVKTFTDAWYLGRYIHCFEKSYVNHASKIF